MAVEFRRSSMRIKPLSDFDVRPAPVRVEAAPRDWG